MLMDFYF